MQDDPLATPASELDDVASEATAYKGRFPAHEIFDGAGFFKYLIKGRKCFLWVMTYTVSLECPILYLVERLIFSVGPSPYLHDQRRLKVHSKLYIQWHPNQKDPVACFIGSQNLVKPTGIDLMVRVPSYHNKLCVKYFQHFMLQ